MKPFIEYLQTLTPEKRAYFDQWFIDTNMTLWEQMGNKDHFGKNCVVYELSRSLIHKINTLDETLDWMGKLYEGENGPYWCAFSFINNLDGPFKQFKTGPTYDFYMWIMEQDPALALMVLQKAWYQDDNHPVGLTSAERTQLFEWALPAMDDPIAIARAVEIKAQGMIHEGL